MPVRQRLERIEQVPKTVHKLATWSDPAKLMADPAFARKVVHLVRCIENGTPLPSGYYRKGAGLDDDGLLRAEGIMHLHLGRSNTAELIYLVQYPHDVVLLELSDHSHFASRPVGARLLNRHGVALAAREAQFTAKSGSSRPGVGRARSSRLSARPGRSQTTGEPKDE